MVWGTHAGLLAQHSPIQQALAFAFGHGRSVQVFVQSKTDDWLSLRRANRFSERYSSAARCLRYGAIACLLAGA